MPSRRVVVLIVVFWFVTTGFVVYRDIWPLLFASGPPPFTMDLEDEATQFRAIDWTVLHGEKKIGRLHTRMTHVDADDSFLFTHRYVQLQFDFSGVRIMIPDLINTTRMTRSGELRAQTMDGKFLVQIANRDGSYTQLVDAHAQVSGHVELGQFVGHCNLESSVFKIQSKLDPVSVRDGHALNPLQPLNRIANLRPRQQWVVQEINPIDEALGALLKKQFSDSGINVPDQRKELLIAEVASSPQVLQWGNEDVPCWVIEYRGGEVRAKTWVRVSDARVLRQEATLKGERIALQREE